MTDWIFVTISMLGFLGFIGIVNVYVMEPDLWVVSLIVAAIAIWFTWQDLKAGGSQIKDNEDENSDG